MIFFSALVLMLTAGVFWSCQKEELLMNNTTDGVMLKAAYVGANCAVDCIDLDNPKYFEMTGNDFVSWGGTNHQKTVSYKAYNTDKEFVIEVSFLRVRPGGGSTNGNIQVNFEGSTNTFESIASGATRTYKFDLPAGWDACDEVSFEIVENSEFAEEGDKVIINIEEDYSLFGVCIDCTPGFSYVDNEDLTYTFTLVPEKDIEGAEVVFTFAQGVVVAGLDEEVWTNKGATWQAELDLEECTTYKWVVTLSADCSGASGTSNVWTDFKVNGFSLKADSDDKFVQICK